MSNFDMQQLYNGPDVISQEEVAKLMKALEANTANTDVSNLSGVGALQLQDLEGSYVKTLHDETHLTMLKDIPQSDAKSTLEQYAKEFGYGLSASGWVGQTENPESADPQLMSETAFIKFQRQMWKFSDVSGLVDTISPAEALAKEAAGLRGMRNVNKALYSGDSTLFTESIDGFEKTIRNNGSPDHVFDLRGGTPTQATFREAGQLISQNFGKVNGSGVYVSPAGQSVLDSVIEHAQFFNQTQIGSDGKIAAGWGIDKIHTSFGTMLVKQDVFIGGEYEDRGVPVYPNPSNPSQLIEGAESANAPGSPTLAVAVQAATDVTGSKFAASGIRPSGVVYHYRVAAGNKYGRGAACALVAANVAVTTGGAMQITITPATGGNPATYFEIFSEQVAGSGVFRSIGKVANSGATTIFVDKNLVIPGTTKIFVIDMSGSGPSRAVTFKRLAPMHSQEFGRQGPYRWGTVNLYGVPLYYAPLKFVMLSNVGVDVSASSPGLNI